MDPSGAFSRSAAEGRATPAAPAGHAAEPSSRPAELPVLRVVGIGASAGGLGALNALFGALPVDTGMAFVVVSHLEPSHPSALAEILGRATALPVAEVRDGDRLAPNHVYVLPAGRDVTTRDGHLHLQERAAQAVHRPVDLFLRSLADDLHDRAIGIILSGTASDGTLGLRAIKAAGGITFAQDDSALQAGMPHSAIADGHVDFVLPPEGIAVELARIGAVHPPWGETDQAEAGAEGLADVLELVRRHTGVDFSQYKGSTLQRRVLRRMILRKIDALPRYAECLRASPDEAQALHDDLLIGVTSFFRDPDAFEALMQAVTPRLAAPERSHEPYRVWVLGCSTGEEAYSLAIGLTECMDAAGVRRPLQIFASDVNATGIAAARTGLFARDIAEDVAPARLARFFVEVDGRYRIVKSIRDTCVFSRHNVLTDPPFSRIDLVSCRNLLMYLQAGLQHDVIRSLHYALVPGGLLWLGSADTVGAHHALFDPVAPAHKVFARRHGTQSHPTLRASAARAHAVVEAAGRPPSLPDLAKDSDRLLLARFAPAAVLVSADMEILQYRGDVAPYIAPAAGKASHQLSQVLDRRLQVAVRAAIAEAQRAHRAVRQDGVRVALPGEHEVTIDLEVVPVGAPARGFLLLFDPDRRTAAAPRRRPRRTPGGGDGDALARVSKELADTQVYLQSVIEGQEAAHEDLEIAHEQAQSANEELQSLNEELETSKEEIQSANEELTTLNEELQHRNVELQHTNNDLLNLLTSTDVAVVFAGADLTIRRFTPAAARALGLRQSDVGRALGELRLPLDARLDEAIRAAMATLSPYEQDMCDAHGRWLSVRVRPYRTTDNHVDGAVVVFVDIDAAVRARLYAESIIATVRTPLVVLDESLTIVTVNDAFDAAFRAGTGRAEGRPFFDVAAAVIEPLALREALQQVLPQDEVVRDLRVQMEMDGDLRTWMVNARRLVHSEKTAPLMLLSMEDVSEREHAEDLRRQRLDEMTSADSSKNEFLAMLAHELRNPLAPIRTAAALLASPRLEPPAAAHARAVIERQIQHMVRLVDDLLNVARITQGKLELQLAPIELTQVVQQAVDVAQPGIDERAQRLSVSAPDGPCFILGDATRLEQAFGNLLHNASKFTGRGGHIRVTFASVRTVHGADVHVHVRDDGIGMAPTVVPHVFELFRQVGDSPHRASGLGVGLALVRRIVELHGGQVEARSAGPGQGSEFVVCLPTLQGAERQEPAAASPVSRAPNGLRVLVVDDNVDAADSLMFLLRVGGHQARAVHEGAAALRTAAEFRPHVAFLDIAMPDIDGYELARRVRAMQTRPRPVLVALTGFGREDDRRRATDAGFDHFVTKPLDPLDLPELLATAEPAADVAAGDAAPPPGNG